MAAMVRPVSIQHADLSHGRVPLLLCGKIILDKLEILEGHSQIQRIVQGLQFCLRGLAEAVKNLHISRSFKYRHQGLWFLGRSLSGIHRVDAEGLDGLRLILC